MNRLVLILLLSGLLIPLTRGQDHAAILQKSPDALVLAKDGKPAYRIAVRTFKLPAGCALKSLTVRALHCEQLGDVPGSGMWARGLDIALPAKPVKNFTYRFRVKSESPSQSYRFGLQFLKADEKTRQLKESDFFRASGWTHISADFTTLVNTMISQGYTRLGSISQRPYKPGGNVPYIVSDVSVIMTDEAPRTLYAGDIESGNSVYGGRVTTAVEPNASKDGVYWINDDVNPSITGFLTGEPATVATGWKLPASTVTIGFAKGWDGAVGEITYGGEGKPAATYRFEDMPERAPLNGVHGGIDFGAGQWVSRVSHVASFDGQAFADGAGNPVDGLFAQAQAAFKGDKFDDALRLYERVLLEHSEASDRWFAAQQGIAETLAKKGDLAEAAKAAHLCMDGAPDLKSFAEAVNLSAKILSALDKNIDRANQLLTFQQSGSASGLTNPMDAIGYPAMPERESAFAAMRHQAGDDAVAARLCAFTFLFTGKPRDALAQFADAFRRNSKGADFQRRSLELLTIGLRAARGHGVGLGANLQFVIYGPHGPDAKPGTADDSADPFAGLLSAPPEPGLGGLATLSQDDLTALRRVRDAAQLYGGGFQMPEDIRPAALLALQRANDALDGWGAAGQKDWYLQLTLGPGRAGMEGPSLAGAQAAAKGRALHLGEVHALWSEIDASYAAKGIQPTPAMAPMRLQFHAICAALNQTVFQQPAPKLLTAPASF